MKKKLLLLSTIGVLLLLLTGCSLAKKAITADDFMKKGEENNLVIVDVKDQFADYDFIEKAIIAASPNGWQVEYYKLDTEDNAKKMYEKNYTTFEQESNKKKTFKTEIGKYETYSIENDDYYMKIIRADNTFLYVKTSESNKVAVKEFMKELGY